MAKRKVSICIDENDYLELRKVCAKEVRSLSSQIRKTIKEYLKNYQCN